MDELDETSHQHVLKALELFPPPAAVQFKLPETSGRGDTLTPIPRPTLTGGISLYTLEQLVPFGYRPQRFFVCVPASLGRRNVLPTVVKEHSLIRMMAPVIKLIRGTL